MMLDNMNISNENVNDVKRKIEKQRKVIIVLTSIIVVFAILILV